MLGALIGAGASLLGGVLGNRSANKQAEQQYQHQKEFAQSGIQWKVEDAEKAGVHPLYALGANTVSYSPTSVGGSDFGIPEAGQNIGRAMDATRSAPATQLAQLATKTQIEGLELDNELKRTQLASAARLAAQTGPHPALPSPFDAYHLAGQGDSGIVSSVPPGHEARAPQYTNPDLALEGGAWSRAPGTSDAQSWEDVYGDESLLPFIINNYKGYRDMLYNSSRWYSRNITDKLRNGTLRRPFRTNSGN